MPVEIIDLISSPDLPVAPIPKVNTTAPKRTLTYEPSKPRQDRWVDLSSDGICPPATKASSAKPLVSPLPVSKAIAVSKPFQSANPVKSFDDFYFLSDDFDTTLSPLTAAATKPSASSVLPKRKLSATSQQNPPVYGLSTGAHFDFLSDDFDSTNFDDPFASDGPAPKMRRLTPSPKATTSKTAVPKKAEFKRTTSNIDSSSKANASLSKAVSGMRRTKSAIPESDPITFTSSPDPFEDAAKRRKDRRKETLYEGEEVGHFDLGPSWNKGKSNTSGSQILQSRHGNKTNEFKIDHSSDLELPDIETLSSKLSFKPAKSSQAALAKYNADKSKERASKEKAEKEKGKDASKEAEKDQKRLAREQKIRDKEKAAEVAKVNTLRTDKKVSAPEMIVDIPSCLESKLAGQARNLLTPLQIEHTEWESTLPVVRWRRKVVAEWNEEQGHWEPVPRRIETEKHVMCLLSANEFVELATGEEGRDLDAHVLRLKAKFHSSEIIYMIEGLRAWMRKNVNLKNRQFTAAVRSHLGQEEQDTTASQKAKTKKKKEQDYVDENMIEHALLSLQVIHGTLIHHTNALIETAEWIVTFTQHISTIPYKNRMQSLDTAFCMESGQVKTGDNAADTYTKMLQEIRMITASVAYGIAAEYPTVQKLVKGLEENGPLALQDCRKCANKDGAFTDRRIGPSISKRVYKVFMRKDAGSWDV